MPEARIASVNVPAKRLFNTTEPGVDESEPFKAKTQKRNGGDSSSFPQNRAENGPLVTKKKGTITQFLSILVLCYILSTDRTLFMSQNIFYALQIINFQQQSPMTRTLLPISRELYQIESCLYPPNIRYWKGSRLRLSFLQCRQESFGDFFYRTLGRYAALGSQSLIQLTIHPHQSTSIL